MKCREFPQSAVHSLSFIGRWIREERWICEETCWLFSVFYPHSQIHEPDTLRPESCAPLSKQVELRLCDRGAALDTGPWWRVFNRRAAAIRPKAPVGPAPHNVAQLVVSASQPRARKPKFPHPTHPRSHQPGCSSDAFTSQDYHFGPAMGERMDCAALGSCAWVDRAVDFVAIDVYFSVRNNLPLWFTQWGTHTIFDSVRPANPMRSSQIPNQVTPFSLWMVE